MTTIKILIYTDTPDITDADDEASWGITELKKFLTTRGPAFAQVELQVVNRFKVPETPRKIDRALLDGVDQLWVFGTYQGVAEQPFDKVFGGRDNELGPAELAHLELWMQKGGVLVAGDHANPDPMCLNDPIATYLCLGRALGHKVPRAGKLRQWVGPPTSLADSSFNTLVNTAEFDANEPSAQEDPVPQKLRLVSDALGQPHRLFMGKDAQGGPRLLDVFPDHAHEGLIILPGKPLGDEWPPKGGAAKPEPAVIAYSCDKRTCASGPALAAYDGDAAGVGRIVADSSWHHYFNVNLRNLKNTELMPTADLLAQFYSNLAVWLSPLEKRAQMSSDMFDWLFEHPEVKEEWGNHPQAVGKVALKYLSKIATPCEILELIQAGLPDEMRDDGLAFNFPRAEAGVCALPSLELVVGSFVKQHYAAASERLRAATSDAPAETKTVRQIVGEGVVEAFRLHSEGLGREAAVVKDFLSKQDGGA